MDINLQNKRILGINGIGRIGKLTLWNHLNHKYFDGIVINAGRELGKTVEDVIHYLTTDSTYGSLDRFMYGYTGKSCNVKILNRTESLIEIDGIPVKILKKARNPREIDWAKENVRIVIDCTGVFLDPTVPADHPKGSLRGHLEAGAEKVILSAPFKIGDSSRKLPDDSSTFVYGVNHSAYAPMKHHIISAASCTTTALAHMVKPLLDTEETSQIVTASMTTVHAATNNQNILDAPPKAGAKDLRRNRSVFNNIIPTSTGAAIALEEIIPEIKSVGFMADSIRIPTSTVSLISLNLTFRTERTESGEPVINQNFINDIYRKAAEGAQKDLLVFSENQNVSSDLMGGLAAVVIEGLENHTRTGFISLDAETLAKYGVEAGQDMNLPVTHAKVFGWYDNEFGCYVNCLGRLTKYVEKNLI
ncbi:MAG: type I glyceraldehyde-3-phosphate dehydrogenase [Anaerovoracaceae bacterium]|jgi:glyceraldehyde 3-phosphate dehydrogenase